MREVPQNEKSAIPWEAGGGTVGYWVKLAYIALRREMDASLREAGLTVTQWQALRVLLHKPCVMHADLIKHLDIEAPSVTSLVNGMERKGWVRRERSADDARAKRLFLTARGKRLIEGLRAASASIEERLALSMSEEDRATLKRLLQSVIEGLR